ncbi:MAG: CBS domain-containing protein [Anaerolineaceae bacterium]|nr:CBS domain-containing protein [Anaerolineaceae bacterium]
MTTCREVMTKDVQCCLPTDIVKSAAKMMRSEDVGSIPVVQSQRSKKLLGIVTDRDLALKVVAEGQDPQQTRIDTVMTSDPITCKENDDVGKAIQAMAAHQIRRILVVNDDNVVLGIIAQADIATRIDQPHTTADVVEKISQSDS